MQAHSFPFMFSPGVMSGFPRLWTRSYLSTTYTETGFCVTLACHNGQQSDLTVVEQLMRLSKTHSGNEIKTLQSTPNLTRYLLTC